MIGKSRGHVSVISLDRFHPSYPAIIRVNCLDEFIPSGFEEDNIYCLFAISVNSEVSNEVEVTPGVHIRALRAAPVGPCYTNYLKWFQLLIRWSYKIIG